MSNIKFSQLPNLATPLANTIVPVVSGGTNYTSTMANITTYVNTNSGAISASSLTASGNVQGAYVKGNGSELTSITGANVTGTVPAATTATTATTAGTVTTNAQPNITSVGTLTTLAVTGDITGGNANLGNAAIANYFIGNGSLLTGLSGNLAGGTLTGNLLTSSYYINQNAGAGGEVLFGDPIHVYGSTSTLENGLITNGTIEINAAGPSYGAGLNVKKTANGSGITVGVTGTANTAIGIQTQVSISNAIGIQITGANTSAKPYALKVANVVVESSSVRTLDGYLAVYVDGNLRYIPYYQ